MINRKLLLGLFICLAAIQLTVTLRTIVIHEMVLRTGHQYKFRTAPVDPYDPFRGRYVALSIQENSAPIDENDKARLPEGQKAYACIAVGRDGFAKFSKVVSSRPQGDDYVQVRVLYYDLGKKVHFSVPFDRYYMEEKAAPEAERIYRMHSSSGDDSDTFVTVRVCGGHAVVEDLYVGGKPIRESIRNNL